MSDAPADKVLFYPVWVSTSGRKSLRWDKPCEGAGAAYRIGKERVASGDATLSFVVRFQDGRKLPLITYTWPTAARTVIEHWDALLAATEDSDAPIEG